MKQVSMDVLYQGKKQPNVFINDDQLTNLDLAEIKLAKESTKYFKVKDETENKRAGEPHLRRVEKDGGS